MRISELAARTGVPLATVKFYLREGLLMPGNATSATQAVYSDEHVRRLGLVRALAVQGLPLHKIKAVVGLVDDPRDDLFAVLGNAIAALPPYVDPPGDGDYPRARRILERLGQVYEPDFAAVAQLEQALAALEAAGLEMSDRRIDVYGRHIRDIAALDLELLPTASRRATVEAAVLGTALYEPVLTAMRRLAHQHLAARLFAGDGDTSDPIVQEPQ
ncbi:MerR family transcriptional regulator [Rhodococcus chondri]|uniref:MerR family transcriptional regulator n=1 Tax=Rhodococcus chondri TaxID=3065941 RepID=A0ABU7JU69_9NOCA|nr:MerR family transcriptional regulator [Rhodococcus sp. CC-R104]MEE2033575.1 MerR family transcriptional regulator [Rhodococcus sp. CC-R104]